MGDVSRETVSMPQFNGVVCHLTFPYLWVECDDQSTCRHAAHLPGGVDELNSYPQEWAAALLGCSFLSDTRVEWWNAAGNLHRLGGPAVEMDDGRTIWCDDDRFHRVDGPAVEWSDGTQEWWVDGKLQQVGDSHPPVTKGFYS